MQSSATGFEFLLSMCRQYTEAKREVVAPAMLNMSIPHINPTYAENSAPTTTHIIESRLPVVTYEPKSAKPTRKRQLKKPTIPICLSSRQVTVSSLTGKVDPKDATKVRANAMKQHHFKRRAGSNAVVAEQYNKYQKHLRFEKLVAQYRIQEEYLGTGRSDPFMRLPVLNAPRRYFELIDHCELTIIAIDAG